MFPESSKWSCAQFPHCSQAGCEWRRVPRHRPAIVSWGPWNQTMNCISLRGELDWKVPALFSLQTRSLLESATRFRNIASHGLQRIAGPATHDCAPQHSKYMLLGKTWSDMPSQLPTSGLFDCEFPMWRCQHVPWDSLAMGHCVNGMFPLPDSSCPKAKSGPDWQWLSHHYPWGNTPPRGHLKSHRSISTPVSS